MNCYEFVFKTQKWSEKDLRHWIKVRKRTNIKGVPGERSVLWEVIVSVILSKKLYLYMCEGKAFMI
jgi:hypothetical protein